MNRFFRYDSKFIRFLNGFADCMVLGACWMICCIPIFTTGAAMTALYHTVFECVMHRNGYAWKEYWHALKSNFKKSTAAWLLWLVLAVFLVLDIVVMRQVLAQDHPLGAMYYFFLVISAMTLAWEFYLFPYMARFENTVIESMKKSFVMAVANLGWSALLVGVLAVCIYICNTYQCLLLFLPGGFAVLKYYVLEKKVFKKYRTTEDLMAEFEKYRENYN